MSDWLQPTLATVYTSWDTALQARADSQALMFDDGVTWTNLRTGTVRWNSVNDRFERWNGSAWANLSTSLTGTLKAVNSLSDVASPTTARSNLGLGSIAVENSPLAVAKGGTGSTTAVTAQANLGLGSMATQAASAVSVTGGTLSGITALTMTSGSLFSFTSSGTIQGVSGILNGGDIAIQTQVLDYWLYLGTAGAYRTVTGAAGFWPYLDNTYALGKAAQRWSEAHVARVRTSQISYASSIAMQISDVTKWVFDSSDFSFRANVDKSYNLGSVSFLWNTLYVLNINGPQVAIHLGDGTGDVHIRYIANTTGDHKFYSTAGAEEVWRLESTGKVFPVKIGRFDYTSATGTSRSIATGATLAQTVDVLGTVLADFIALGLFQ